MGESYRYPSLGPTGVYLCARLTEAGSGGRGYRLRLAGVEPLAHGQIFQLMFTIDKCWF